MADTGAPWNLPYPLPTDLVRDGADAIKDLAEATADGLDAAGGLVAVKHVLKTDTFVSSSISAGANVAVDGLSITHAMADADNKLIISAFFGVAGSDAGSGQVGIAIDDGTSLIGIGDAEGSRTQLTAGGRTAGTIDSAMTSMLSVTFVHEPNTTDSQTYSVVAVNIRNASHALYINRAVFNTNDARASRGASALIIQEVKV